MSAADNENNVPENEMDDTVTAKIQRPEVSKPLDDLEDATVKMQRPAISRPTMSSANSENVDDSVTVKMQRPAITPRTPAASASAGAATNQVSEAPTNTARLQRPAAARPISNLGGAGRRSVNVPGASAPASGGEPEGKAATVTARIQRPVAARPISNLGNNTDSRVIDPLAARNTASSGLKKVAEPVVDPLAARGGNSNEDSTVTASIRRPVAGALKDKLAGDLGKNASDTVSLRRPAVVSPLGGEAKSSDTVSLRRPAAATPLAEEVKSSDTVSLRRPQGVKPALDPNLSPLPSVAPAKALSEQAKQTIKLRAENATAAAPAADLSKATIKLTPGAPVTPQIEASKPAAAATPAPEAPAARKPISLGGLKKKSEPEKPAVAATPDPASATATAPAVAPASAPVAAPAKKGGLLGKKEADKAPEVKTPENAAPAAAGVIKPTVAAAAGNEETMFFTIVAAVVVLCLIFTAAVTTLEFINIWQPEWAGGAKIAIPVLSGMVQ